MKNVAFLCDSSADITAKQAADLNIYVLRMPIIVNGVSYIEEETIQDYEIIEALNRGDKVTTTQPSLGEIMTMWETLLQDYDEVFYIPLSKALSGTCRNALQLATQGEFINKVTVVDSEYVCYPVIKQLEVAREMFALDYEAKEIKRRLEEESDMFAVLIPENLTALKNGGRISPAAAALGGLLKIHPLLKVEHGGIDVQDKVRTIQKAYREAINVCLKDINPKDYMWMIIDADNRKVSDDLKVMLEEAVHEPVEQHVFKAVIMSHTGPGTIGIGRIKKLKY